MCCIVTSINNTRAWNFKVLVLQRVRLCWWVTAGRARPASCSGWFITAGDRGNTVMMYDDIGNDDAQGSGASTTGTHCIDNRDDQVSHTQNIYSYVVKLWTLNFAKFRRPWTTYSEVDLSAMLLASLWMDIPWSSWRGTPQARRSTTGERFLSTMMMRAPPILGRLRPLAYNGTDVVLMLCSKSAYTTLSNLK